MTEEQWRPIIGYEGCYEVSDQGRVRGVDRAVLTCTGGTRAVRGRLIRPWITAKGYVMVRLNRDGQHSPVGVHRLVLMAFVGPCPPGMEGCHNNGNKADCSVGNLRWDTRSENAYDRVLHGTHHEARKTHCPRRHLLADPNLVTSADGRMCKACNRAHGNVRSAKLRGETYDFAAWADDHYVRIMGR